MKKITLILFIVALFAIINIVPLHQFIANVQGHSLFKNSEYTTASDKFFSAGNNYNVANSYYKLGEYESAIETYEALEKKNHAVYHNIGNAYYFWSIEEKTSLSKKLSLLKKSLSNYKKAEAIQIDDDTTVNKEIVEEEIKKLEDALKKADEEALKQEEDLKEQSAPEGGEEDTEESSEGQAGDDGPGDTQQEEGNENTQSDNAAQNPDESNTDGEDSEESGQKQEQKGEDNSSGNPPEGSETNDQQSSDGSKNSGTQQEGELGLNNEQREAIENYTKNLEKSQQEYGEYYNKTYNENRSGFESLFGTDPFFNNSLLENGDKKKDW